MATLIDTLVTRFDFKSNTGNLSAINSKIKDIGSTTAATSALIGKFGKMLGFLGVSLGLSQAMQFANSWGVINRSLKTTGLSGEALEDTLSKLKETAKTSGISLENTAKNFQSLKQSQGDYFTDTSIVQLLDTLGKSIRVYGADTEEAEASTEKLVDLLKTPGKIESRKVLSLMRGSNNIAGIINDYYRKLGTTAKDALENGIQSEELIKIFLSVNDRITKDFEKMDATLGAAKKNLTNQMSEFFGRFRADSGLTQSLAKITQKLADVFEYLANKIAENKAAFKAFGEVLQFLFAGVVMRMIIKNIRTLGNMFWLLWKRILPLFIVPLLLQDIWVFLRGGKSAFGDFLKWLGLSDDEIVSLRENIKGAAKAIGRLFKGLVYIIGEFGGLKTILIGLVALWGVGVVIKFTKALLGIRSAAVAAGTALAGMNATGVGALAALSAIALPLATALGLILTPKKGYSDQGVLLDENGKELADKKNMVLPPGKIYKHGYTTPKSSLFSSSIEEKNQQTKKAWFPEETRGNFATPFVNTFNRIKEKITHANHMKSLQAGMSMSLAPVGASTTISDNKKITQHFHMNIDGGNPTQIKHIVSTTVNKAIEDSFSVAVKSNMSPIS